MTLTSGPSFASLTRRSSIKTSPAAAGSSLIATNSSTVPTCTLASRTTRTVVSAFFIPTCNYPVVRTFAPE